MLVSVASEPELQKKTLLKSEQSFYRGQLIPDRRDINLNKWLGENFLAGR